MTARKKLKVALLATPETTASTVYGMYDLFCSAGRDWDFVVGGVPGAQKIEPRIVAASAAPFVAANGIWIRPDCAFADFPDPDVVCVSDLFVTPDEDVARRHAAAIGWLFSAYIPPRGGGAGALTIAAGGILLAVTRR